MIQLALVAVVLVILILYLMMRPEKEASSELERKGDLFKREVTRLLQEISSNEILLWSGVEHRLPYKKPHLCRRLKL